MTLSSRAGAAVLVAGLMLGSRASAQATDPASPPGEDAESPFAPMIRDLGRRLGVDLSVGRVALNPLIGAVILRDVEARSEPQGRFLTAARVVTRLDVASGGGDAHVVDVEGARLSLDVSKAVVTGERQAAEGERTGKVRLARLRGVDVELRDGDRQLVVGKGLTGRATDVEICRGGGESGGVCASLAIDGGSARFSADDELRLAELQIDGRLEGRRLELASLTGSLGGGRIRCKGAVTVFEKGRSGTKVACHLEDVRISRPGTFDLVVTGDVRISGKGRGVTITGTVDAVSGTQLRAGRWGEGPASDAVTVDLQVRISAPAGRLGARISGSPTTGRVVLDGRRARSAAHVREVLSGLGPGARSAEPDGGARPGESP